MHKIKYLCTRIKNLNYKELFITIKKIHYKTGKNRIIIFLDIVYCGIKYQAGYTDYGLFKMYEMNKVERQTVITRGINNYIIKTYNNPSYFHIFHNKQEFNNKFHKYLKRDWLYLNNNYDEFLIFIKKHPKFIAKPIDLECGKNITLINTKRKNYYQIYETLINNQQLLIEELAVQCKELNKLHPNSINTIRIVTLKSQIVAAYLRIGDKKNIVDNFNHDGFLCPIDIISGKINFPAVKKDGTVWEVHPLTHEPILHLQIPKWQEAKKICVEASKIVSEIGYIGFDVCIGPTFCSIIEANEFPGHDLYGLPAHRIKSEGLYPVFKEILERKEQ